MRPTSEEFEIAQDGLKRIEDVILQLLDRHPQGLRNSEIAEELGLRSDFMGKQKDYLTYPIWAACSARDKWFGTRMPSCSPA